MEPSHANPPRCDNCGVEIPWKPVMHRDRAYCCGGCAQGGPCYCSYDLATRPWLLPSRIAARTEGRTRRTTAITTAQIGE